MTQTHLVLTAIGPDRPGLVSALSSIVATGGGNWLDSRMARLAGQFAGIVLVAVAVDKADALTAALRQLEAEGLRLVVEKGLGAHESSRAGGDRMKLELLGHDRPGIVRDVSRVLADMKVSIDELETHHGSGSFSGEAMFKAHALLRLPQGLEPERVREALETLANEMMVDLNPAPDAQA
jgi:glycine cleavage system regulatory protein